MFFYQKHWAKPKHSFVEGDLVTKDGHRAVVVTWPYSAWIFIRWISGPCEGRKFDAFHGDLEKVHSG